MNLARGSRVLTAGLVVAGGLGLVWLLWQTFIQLFLVQWNAPRLAAPAAFVRGLDIYGTADHGPFLGWSYGPVFPLVFGSVGWLSDQVVMHGAAWGLNLLVVAGPAWLVARVGGGRYAAACAVVIGGLVALGTGNGRTALSFLHVDLLTCFFGVMACLALARNPGGRGVVIAAVASVLAMGTKHVAVALVVGLAFWLWRADRRRELVRYGVWVAVTGAAAAVIAVQVFGLEELVFNLWTIHRHNPPYPGWANELAHRFVGLGVQLLPAGMVLAVIRPDRPATVPDGVADRLERALAWVALAHLPLGLMAAAKVAGGLNSVHSFNYLWFLLVLRLARVLTEPGGLGRAGRGLVVVAAVLALAQGWRGSRLDSLPAWPPVQRLRDDEALARREAGRIYFPWNPLVTVLTEGQVRPFDDALLCLDRCGLPADSQAVLAGIPSGALVVYPDPVQSTFALRFLQDRRR